MFTRHNLLVATALLEVGSGLACLLVPATAIWLLLGATNLSSEALATARLYGVALAALGVACWYVRDQQFSAAHAVLCGMLTYNVGAACILPFVAVVHGISGVLLWPAAVLHAALTLWCVTILRGKGHAPEQ